MRKKILVSAIIAIVLCPLIFILIAPYVRSWFSAILLVLVIDFAVFGCTFLYENRKKQEAEVYDASKRETGSMINKDINLATFLSLIPGLGYIYIGKIGQGIGTFFIILVFTIITYWIGTIKGAPNSLYWIFGLFILLVLVGYFVQIIGTRMACKSMNKVLDKQFKVSNRKCPFCAEIIKAEAKVCRYCGRDIPSKLEGEK